jgi:very-short-patch-repair endonuclease
MATPYLVAASLGHIASRQQLIRSGLRGSDLTRAVRTGELFRVRQAVYASRRASPDAIEATRVGGRLAGVSAARTYGLWAGLDERIHIALAPNASRLRTNYDPSSSRTLTSDLSDRSVSLHWVKASASRECWRVSLADCLRQVVEWSDQETSLACLDTAIQKQKITTSKLKQVFRDQSFASRLISSRALPGSDSGVESIVRQRLERIGIAVRQQVRIPGVGHVDMVVSGSRVVIEADGQTYHSSPKDFEKDRRRDAELARRGYTCLRFSYIQVMFNWPWCERMVLGTLASFRS